MISATVIGNMGVDSELRYLADGTAVLELRIASNGRDKMGGEWKDVPTWVRVSLFGKRAESLAKLGLTKGTKIAARGDLKLREFDRRDGGKGSSLEMRADDVELLGGKQDGATRPATNGGGARQPGEDKDPGF